MDCANLFHHRVGPLVDYLGRRVLIQITVVASAFPLLVLVNFYLFVSLTRIDLGHWPVFNDPYPRMLPAVFQRVAIALSLMTFPAVSLAAVLLSLLGRWCYGDFPMWRLLALGVFTAGLLVIVAQIDPGSFLNWFVD